MNKEEAIRILRGDVLGTNEQTHEAVFMAIKALKAEPKRGKWTNDGKAYALYQCSACNEFCTVAGYANCIPEERMYKTMKYCPNCGAKMERSVE